MQAVVSRGNRSQGFTGVCQSVGEENAGKESWDLSGRDDEPAAGVRTVYRDTPLTGWQGALAGEPCLSDSCYSMSMPLEHRLQVLIDEERHRRIVAVAKQRGVSVATVVREAIDRGVTNTDTQRAAAGRRLLEAPDMEVPEPGELRVELDALRGRRA
jgi:hypothetical protein